MIPTSNQVGTGRYGTIKESAVAYLGLDKTPVTIEQMITSVLGDHAADYDIAAITRAITARLNEALPEGYTIHGAELAIAPHTPALTEDQRQNAADAWPQGQDLIDIIEANRLT